MTRRGLNSALAVALVVAGFAGCTGNTDGTKHIALTEDTGEAESDLTKAAGLKKLFLEPRRYPFTLAVCPLRIDWTDKRPESVHSVTFTSPLPGVSVKVQKQLEDWPKDRDGADEENAMLRVMREGYAKSEEAGAEEDEAALERADAEAAAALAGDLLLRFLLRQNRGVWHLDAGNYDAAEVSFSEASCRRNKFYDRSG